MRNLTRREMMAKTAQVLAGLALAGGCACPQSRCTSGGKGFKIGACDWTLGKQANPACFEVAENIGIDGVQLSFNTMDRQVHLQDPKIRDAPMGHALCRREEQGCRIFCGYFQRPVQSDL